jgi:hypothetical protein
MGGSRARARYREAARFLLGRCRGGGMGSRCRVRCGHNQWLRTEPQAAGSWPRGSWAVPSWLTLQRRRAGLPAEPGVPGSNGRRRQAPGARLPALIVGRGRGYGGSVLPHHSWSSLTIRGLGTLRWGGAYRGGEHDGTHRLSLGASGPGGRAGRDGLRWRESRRAAHRCVGPGVVQRLVRVLRRRSVGGEDRG